MYIRIHTILKTNYFIRFKTFVFFNVACVHTYVCMYIHYENINIPTIEFYKCKYKRNTTDCVQDLTYLALSYAHAQN